MSKFSSDSDSSNNDHYPNRKMNRRSRSSSSSSNDSHYSSKKRSYRHKRSKGHRSRSRDKYNKSRSRHSREGSRSIYVPSTSSKTKGSKPRSRSSSKERKHKRSTRKSKGRSRHHSSSSSSTSSSSSSSKGRSASKSPVRYHSDVRTLPLPSTTQVEMSSEEALKAKLQQAMRAAQNADNQLRQQGFLTGTSSRKEIVVKQPSASVLEEINSPSFVQKPFVSGVTPSLAPDNELPGLAKKLANPQTKEDESSIFHPNLRADLPQKLEKWVKKLYILRQKAINGEPLV